MHPTATGEIAVNASPDRVYALLCNLDSLGALAEETVRCTALDGTATAKVGTRFRGANRRGFRRWSTLATVTDAAPGREFAFNVTSLGIPVARWSYSIRPSDDGCLVTERTWDHRPKWFRGVAWLATGVADRAAANTRNIARTLRRLKARAES